MRRTPFSAGGGAERIGALTLVGLVAAPLVVVAALSWGLWAPVQNLDRITAAVVNDDEPVTQNGRTIPLGRQFAAALMEGAPVSTASGGGPAEAPPANAPDTFDWVLTSDDDATAGLASGTYAAVLTIPGSFSADATSIGGDASNARQATVSVQTSGSAALIDPALTQAITQAATASLGRQLTVSYLQNVYAGFNTISQQIGSASAGAASLSSGASSLATGSQSLANGAATLATGTQSLNAGAQSLASGLSTLSAQTQPLPAQAADLAAGSSALAGAADEAAGKVGAATDTAGQVMQQACQTPGPLCTLASNAYATLQSADQGTTAFADASDRIAAGNQALASALPRVVSGIDASAVGAGQVASGAASASAGAAALSSGAASTAAGAQQVDSGAAQLASGLATASTAIPTFSDSDIATLSAVVAEPVVTDQKPTTPDVASVPLFVVLALWLGGMLTVLARRAVPVDSLLSAAGSPVLALRSAGVVAAIGAAQGVVVAGAAQFWLGLRPDVWLGFAVAAVFAGAVFGVLNQALAAALGGLGRLVTVIVAVLALVAGLSSTVPPGITAFTAAAPTGAGLGMLRAAAMGDADAALGSAGVLAVYAAVGLGVLIAAVAARRGVRTVGLARV